MSEEKVVKLRVTLDTSTLAASSGAGKAAVASIGEAGASVAAKVNAAVAEAQGKIDQLGRTGSDAASKLGAAQAQVGQAYQQSGTAIDRFVESQADATTRIREMVQASLAQIEATKNAGEAQKTLAERSGMTADQAARLNEQLLAQANSAERMRERSEALSAAEAKRAGAAATTARNTKDEGDALNKLLGQIDPVIAKLGQLDAMEEQLKKFRASGAIGADDYAVFSQKLGQLREQATGAGEGMHQLSLNSAGAKREIGVLIGELARGNFAALEGSTITLANRTGLLSLAFSGVGLTIGALFAVIGGGLAIYASAERENDAFNRGLIATGNYAGTSVGQLRDQASAIGDATGEYGKAAEALTKLVSSGKLSGDALGDAARGAVALSEVTGKSIEQSIAEFEKLADDPVKAVVKLNDSYHFLTLAVYDQIKALQDQGNQEAATSLAIKTAADALDQRRKDIVDNAGAIERAWRGVKSAIGEAIDNLKQVGRADVQGRLQSAYADLASIDDQRQEVNGGGVKGFIDNLNPYAKDNLEAERTAKLALIKTLEDQVKAQDKADTDAAKQTHLRENAVAAGVAIDAATLSLDKQAKKLHDIQELNANYAKLFANPGRADDARLQGVSQTPDGGFAGGDYDKLLGAINEKYSDHGKAARDAAKGEREFKAAVDAQAAAMDKLQKATESANAQTSPLDAAFAHFVETLRANNAEAAKAIEQSDKLGEAGLSLSIIQEKLAAANANATSNYREETAAIIARSKLSTGNSALLVQLQQQRDKLAGLSAAQVTYNKGVEQANKEAAVEIAQGRARAEVAAELAARIETLGKLRDGNEVESIVEQFGGDSEFERLIKNIESVGEAMEKVGDKGSAAFAVMQKTSQRLNDNLEQRNLALVSTGVSSLQKYAKEGTVAYTALGIAQDILAYKAAVAAIATQGEGDPYSAFARIAAMISLMASIGIRVAGGASQPSSQGAEARQALQGTGSVLGDASAKSESIANATEITANATSQLVGINRGMLTALQALQSALGAAGNQLARGAGDAPFATPTDGLNIGDPFGKDPVGNFLGDFLFGGSKEIIDQGIVIAGGALNDMLNKIVVGAYQTIETDGGLFGSDKINDQLIDISDGFGKQFQLVIKSIADTVRQGALALGLLPADVEAALAAYQVESIRISLKGLSAEDQQKELEAVFSKLFDGLAGSVVPFIGQFQKVGEGLGETLVRVATEVQVAQEAFKQLGLSVDESDPEKFAQISDALVTAAGGLDAFISGMQSFVSKFAPDAHQLEVQSDALTSAFSQVGLTVPTTRDAMFALMQTLDATTDAGRSQIATLLRLADTADAYYTALDKRAKAAADYAGFVADLAQQAGKVGGFVYARLQIGQWEQETIKQANNLARAAGLQGASEQDLALIHEVAAQKIVDALRAIKDESRDIVDRLNGVNTSASSASTAVGNFGSAMTTAAEAAQAAAELLLGDKSPFNDQQKLQYAIDAYQRGLVNKDQVLEIGRRLYATSQQYTDLFNLLQRTPGGIRDATANSSGAGGSSSSETRSADEIAADRHRDAEQLAQNIASIAYAQNQSYADVASDLKYGLGSLANDLGLTQDQLTDYLDNLKKQQSAVGDAIDGNTDRLIAALYDIAGLPPPVQSGPAAGGPIAPDELPRRPRSTVPAPLDRDLDDPGTDPRRPRSIIIPDADENGRARPTSDDQANTKQTAIEFAAMRAVLNELLTATRDGVAATRGVAPALGDALRDTTRATAVLAQRALADDQAALQRLRSNGRGVEA